MRLALDLQGRFGIFSGNLGKLNYFSALIGMIAAPIFHFGIEPSALSFRKLACRNCCESLGRFQINFTV
jgi:hypothetical protein